VWEMGPDGRARWKLFNLQGPMDAQVLSNGHVLIAEYQGRVVTERDLNGRIHWSKTVEGNPIGCRRLPNGNTFVATHTSMMEISRDGKEVYLHYPGEGVFILCAERLQDRRIVCLADPGILLELDAATGKPIKTLRLGSEFGGWCGVAALPGGRYLAAFLDSSKAIE